MYKFNRKQAIGILNPDSDELIKALENKFEPIGRGWVIYWKGEPMKPKRGNNHFYASREAALQGIDRNVNISSEVKKIIANSIYGFEYLSTEWKDYFRYDLWEKARRYNNSRSMFSTDVEAEDLTEDEKEIFQKTRDEEDKFNSFCLNALKSVLVPKWLEQELLQIKYV
jgi:hypothetical protein